MNRLFLVAVLVGALAEPAAAATTVRFHAGTERARVSVSDGRVAERGYVELVRAGLVIARSAERNGLGAAGGHVKVPSLVTGDVVNAYGSGALIATAAYDGRPLIAGACAGRRSFTVTRDEHAATVWVGASGRRVTWADASVFSVAVDRALAAGRTASVITTRDRGGIRVISRLDARIGACRVTPAARVPPTDREVRRATRRAVAVAAAKLRRARLGRSVTVPFRFIEPGSVRLDLAAGRVALGSGVRTVARSGRASVRIELTRRRAGRLTLRATFVPARAGARPQTARATVPRL